MTVLRTRRSPGPLRNLPERSRVWGGLQVWPTRYGFTRYLLVVYPPGTSASERRRVRIALAYPAWGGVLALGVLIVAGLMLPALLATGLAIAALLGGFLMRRLVAGPMLLQVRTCSALTALPGSGSPGVGRIDLLEAAWRLLDDADQRRRTGLISPAQHEMLWSEAYATLS